MPFLVKPPITFRGMKPEVDVVLDASPGGLIDHRM
jgi:hypothetical protein